MKMFHLKAARCAARFIAIMGLCLNATTSFAADEALLSGKVSQHNRIIEPQLKLISSGPNTVSVPIQVALTLDACSGEVDYRILDVLVRENIPATLFVTSRWLRRNPAAIKVLQAHPELFQIENHGAEHVPAITGLKTMYDIPTAGTSAAIAAEVKGGADKISEIFGRKPAWYRDATARYSTDAVRQIEMMGYRIAGYSLNGDRGASLPAATVARRIAAAENGDVIIAHINQPKRVSGAGVAEGIVTLKRKGVVFRLLQDVQTRATAPVINEFQPDSAAN